MKSYQWWKKQKKRVQKKYTLLLGRYLSPKELRERYNHMSLNDFLDKLYEQTKGDLK